MIRFQIPDMPQVVLLFSVVHEEFYLSRDWHVRRFFFVHEHVVINNLYLLLECDTLAA